MGNNQSSDSMKDEIFYEPFQQSTPIRFGEDSNSLPQDFPQQQNAQFTTQSQSYSEWAFQFLQEKTIQNTRKSLRNNIKNLTNNFVKYSEEMGFSELEPVKKFIQKRNLNKKGKNKDQKIGTIKQFQELSKELQVKHKNLIPDFIRDDQFLYLVYSNRIENPMDQIQTINNFYASSQEPEKMIGNDQIEKNVDQH